MSKSSKKRKQLPTAVPPRRNWIPWLLLALTIAGTSLVRLRLLDMPLERDEGEFAYAGQLMLQGVPPYTLAFSMKMPGIHAAYALIMLLFGQTARGIHFGLTLVNAGSILMMFLLGKRLFEQTVGAAAAMVFGITSLSPAVLGLAGHATHFVVLFALAGLLVLLRAMSSGSRTLFFASGLLFGSGFLMKQPGALLGAFGGLWILIGKFSVTKPEGRDIWPRLAAYSAGCLVPFLVTCMILWGAGTFSAFWYWTVVRARDYGVGQSWSEGKGLLVQSVTPIIATHWPLVVLAAVGLALLWWRRNFRGIDTFVELFAVFSALAVCPGLWFRSHYFILCLPAFSLLAGIGVGASMRNLRERGAKQSWQLLPMGILLFGVIFAAWSQRNLFFRLDPNQVCQSIYGDNPFVPCVEVSRFLRDNSAEDSRLAVFGSEPEIYFYAHRHSASGYIYMYDLGQATPASQAMQQQMVNSVTSTMPELIVFVNSGLSWFASRTTSTALIRWGLDFAKDNYRLVGEVELSGQVPIYRWGSQVPANPDPAQTAFLIYRRKTN